MKKYLIGAALIVIGTAASAGLLEPPMEMSDDDADLTGALVLLALIGVVVASSALTGRNEVGDGSTLLPAEDDEDN